MDLFASSSVDAAVALIASARSLPRADDVRVMLAHVEHPMWLSASLFRQESAAHFLVRLTPVHSQEAASDHPGRQSRILEVVESLPDGFVVTDTDRRIMTANAAFLELAQLATEEQAQGQPIDRWIGRTGVDMDVLIANLREHGSVREFGMLFRGEYGSVEDVAISAVAVPDGDIPSYGFSIRKVARKEVFDVSVDKPLHQSIERLTKLVGRVPMKDLVRDTTDLIERMCIEAALELTGDNRASAAEMLGLSRQSLYVKLRRHSLGLLEADTAD
jgi:transcriptional regulator PpsR